MNVHLVDGTYELFRYWFALPGHVDGAGREVGATRGVLGSMLALLEHGATHVGIATDHVVESFRNGLWDGYKTGEGVDADLLSQFPLLEEVLDAAGFVVFPMVEYEADDALAAAAVVAADDERVAQVLICTPDKDLGQCVVAERVVQLDRRKDIVLDAQGVEGKFGVPPSSIPDYLALVGDTADGFPGLRGWGAKSAAAVLARYHHLEAIPDDVSAWDVEVRGAAKLAATLATSRPDAELFRTLATLVTEGPEVATVDELRWRGPRDGADALLRSIDAPRAIERIERLAEERR